FVHLTRYLTAASAMVIPKNASDGISFSAPSASWISSFQPLPASSASDIPIRSRSFFIRRTAASISARFASRSAITASYGFVISGIAPLFGNQNPLVLCGFACYPINAHWGTPTSKAPPPSAFFRERVDLSPSPLYGAVRLTYLPSPSSQRRVSDFAATLMIGTLRLPTSELYHRAATV